jgi:hypothetical protein
VNLISSAVRVVGRPSIEATIELFPEEVCIFGQEVFYGFKRRYCVVEEVLQGED